MTAKNVIAEKAAKPVKTAAVWLLQATAGAALLCAGLVEAQEFSAVTVEAGRDDPKTIFSADLDGDGDVDLVSGSDGDALIAWAENVSGDATLWATHTIAGDASGIHSVFVGDMDGDGDGDVLAATRVDDTLAWYENDLGSTDLWVRHVVTVNVDLPKHAIAHDIDGDGDLDAVSASALDDKIAWFENASGNGTVWIEHVVSTLVVGPVWVAVDDMDGDGDLDVATASSTDTTILWFENVSGDGGLWSEHIVTSASFFARRVLTADFDGDGDVDLAASSTFAGALYWYENIDSLGTVWGEHLVSASIDTVKDIHLGDIDGDGDTDLISAALNDNKISWFENTGAGTRWLEHDTEALVDAPAAVHAADADQDGDLDIFFATIGFDEIGCLLSDVAYRGRGARLAPVPPPG